MIYVDAVKRADSFDKEKVRSEIEKTKGYVGTAGTFDLSDSNHIGLDPSASDSSRSARVIGCWSIRQRAVSTHFPRKAGGACLSHPGGGFPC